MKDVILILVGTAVALFGFFIMKRLDAFLEENRQLLRKEQGEMRSLLQFLDTECNENMIAEIENFKKTHKNAVVMVFDADHPALADALIDYRNRR